ncbi:DNA polymerase III subunit delta' [Sphingomonas sp. MG17]|uniref:DNA polymerase III subunit delta n=1 Tax=Sphingomonas tagetis TaxID=2949092 RepID=A0A9X2KJZ8_9SPHN|nr:DNA polymerase III subunit delta' [Sphingomonas tagetis]MCP3729087.1 DNA polymerase III subunit delta' [Sphingomonas tagetis]
MTSLAGNAAAKAAFRAAMSGAQLHHAWLFAGPEGVGKASFARAAAMRMLAEGAGASDLPGDFDVLEAHHTRRMIEAGAHPDYRVLERLPKDPAKPDENLARSIPIGQVRGLGPMFATKPSMSSRRVVVIDSIDDVERPGAANALLKNLEEPPEGTIFLLVSHSPGRLLPTIRSRCRLLRFDPLSDAEVAGVLRAELPEASAAEIDALVRAGGGSPGKALGFAGLDLATLDGEMAAIAARGDADNAIRSRLARTLGAKAAQPRYEAFLARVPAFIAAEARNRHGRALADALEAYDTAAHLGPLALAQSLDAQATVFEMGGILARLATR